MKFQVGDKVRINTTRRDRFMDYNGKEGVVEKIRDFGVGETYVIVFNPKIKEGELNCYSPDELELVEEPILTDGGPQGITSDDIDESLMKIDKNPEKYMGESNSSLVEDILEKMDIENQCLVHFSANRDSSTRTVVTLEFEELDD